MKIKNILITIAALGIMMSCDPDEPDFDSVDVSSIDSIYNTLSGPTTVMAGTRPQFSILSRNGSSVEWVQEGAEATVMDNGNYEFMASVLFKYFDTGSGEATITATETTEYGVVDSYEIDVEVVPFSNTLSGPESFIAGLSGTYSVSNHPGSTYEWVLVAPDNGTIEGEGSTVTITSVKTEEPSTAILTITETPADGPAWTESIEINIKGFCEYEADWSGSFAALEDYGSDTYGPYNITFVQDTEDPNKFTFDNFWDSGITVFVVFDPESFDVTFPDQDDGDGVAITGSGSYNQCDHEFTITTEYDGYVFDYVFVAN